MEIQLELVRGALEETAAQVDPDEVDAAVEQAKDAAAVDVAARLPSPPTGVAAGGPGD
jgi:hypothetical protein